MVDKVLLKWRVTGKRKDFTTGRVWKLFLLPFISFLFAMILITLILTRAKEDISYVVKIFGFLFLYLIILVGVTILITSRLRERIATIEYTITDSGISKIDVGRSGEVGKGRRFALGYEKLRYSIFPWAPGGQFYRPLNGFQYYTVEDGKIILWEKFFKVGFMVIPNNNLNKIESILSKHVSKR